MKIIILVLKHQLIVQARKLSTKQLHPNPLENAFFWAPDHPPPTPPLPLRIFVALCGDGMDIF